MWRGPVGALSMQSKAHVASYRKGSAVFTVEGLSDLELADAVEAAYARARKNKAAWEQLLGGPVGWPDDEPAAPLLGGATATTNPADAAAVSKSPSPVSPAAAAAAPRVQGTSAGTMEGSKQPPAQPKGNGSRKRRRSAEVSPTEVLDGATAHESFSGCLLSQARPRRADAMKGVPRYLVVAAPPPEVAARAARLARGSATPSEAGDRLTVVDAERGAKWYGGRDGRSSKAAIHHSERWEKAGQGDEAVMQGDEAEQGEKAGGSSEAVEVPEAVEEELQEPVEEEAREAMEEEVQELVEEEAREAMEEVMSRAHTQDVASKAAGGSIGTGSTAKVANRQRPLAGVITGPAKLSAGRSPSGVITGPAKLSAGRSPRSPWHAPPHPISPLGPPPPARQPSSSGSESHARAVVQPVCRGVVAGPLKTGRPPSHGPSQPGRPIPGVLSGRHALLAGSPIAASSAAAALLRRRRGLMDPKSRSVASPLSAPGPLSQAAATLSACAAAAASSPMSASSASPPPATSSPAPAPAALRAAKTRIFLDAASQLDGTRMVLHEWKKIDELRRRTSPEPERAVRPDCQGAHTRPTIATAASSAAASSPSAAHPSSSAAGAPTAGSPPAPASAPPKPLKQPAAASGAAAAATNVASPYEFDVSDEPVPIRRALSRASASSTATSITSSTATSVTSSTATSSLAPHASLIAPSSPAPPHACRASRSRVRGTL